VKLPIVHFRYIFTGSALLSAVAAAASRRLQRETARAREFRYFYVGAA
jgi:hypothetical protein